VAIGIITEASELLEEFRFFDADQCERLLRDPAKRERIEDELADVLFFVLRFAQRFDVDLSAALEAKLVKSARKYPVEKARGRNLKYTEL
jgi:NTP pyrophosphatase (non-canonical NTP hydrolase)